MHQSFIAPRLGTPSGTTTLGARFVPGHVAAPPQLAQGVIENVLKSPWVPIALEAGTGGLLIALALTTTDWAQLAALLGAGYWLYRAAADMYLLLTPKKPEV